MKFHVRSTLLTCLLLGSGLTACGVPETGLPPPDDALYFPAGLAAHPDGRYLYVANTGFDRRYNAGTVTVFDTFTRRLLPAATVRTALFAGEIVVARFGVPDLVLDSVPLVDSSGVSLELRNAGGISAENVVVTVRVSGPVGDVFGSSRDFEVVAVEGPKLTFRSASFASSRRGRLGLVWSCIGSEAECRTASDGGQVSVTTEVSIAGSTARTLRIADSDVQQTARVQALFTTREDSALTVMAIDATKGDSGAHLDCGQGDGLFCTNMIDRYQGITSTPAVGNDPYGLALDATGVYVSHTGRGEVSRWQMVGDDPGAPDQVTPRGICRMSLAAGASSIARHPTLGFAYVTDRRGQVVSVVETLDPLDRGALGKITQEKCRLEEKSPLVVSRDPTLGRTRGLAFSADGTLLYVASASDGALHVYDTSVGARGRPQNRRIATIPLGRGPNVVRVAGLRPGERRAPGGPDLGAAGRIIDEKGGGFIFISVFDDDRVIVVDPLLLAVVAQIEVGDGPHEIVFMPNADDALQAYVSNFRAHTLTMIDIEPRSPRRFESIADLP